MDIIQRNFIRLLRQGAFGTQEQVEPMSAWKWNRLYQLSRIHGVTPWIADGIRRGAGDFFLQIRPELRTRFENDDTERIEEPEEQKLTNPLLNRRLQKLLDGNGANEYTTALLQTLIAIARNILTQGISLRQFIMLGTYLRNTKDPIDYELLRKWIEQLKMGQMARLEASLLTELFGFGTDEVLFAEARTGKSIGRAMHDIFKMTEKKATDWYFTQGKSIFVRSSDSDAMMWHVKQSAKYMHYYPSEALTSFMANFAHSLSHIEE